MTHTIINTQIPATIPPIKAPEVELLETTTVDLGYVTTTV
jgi:hypothetical protein